MLGIGNYVAPLPIPLIVSDLTHLSENYGTSSVEIKIIFDRMRLDMIAKSIEGQITKTYLNKLRLCCGVYECTDGGVIISNDELC